MELGPSDTLLSIAELAEKSGISRRTVRYYVQRGLIDPPVGRGRGSGYTEKHVQQIRRVLHLQREGLPLESIGHLADADSAAIPVRPVAFPQICVRLPLAPGIRLEVEEGATLPPPEILNALAEACARIMQKHNVAIN